MCYFYKKITGLLKLVGEGKEKGHMNMINFYRERVRRCYQGNKPERKGGNQ